MNDGRNYAGTCIDTIEEKIYVVAGCLTKKASTAEVFDIKTSKWTNIANTNTKRDSSGVIHVPQIGRIFSIGGYNNRNKEYITQNPLNGKPLETYILTQNKDYEDTK